MAVYTVNYHSKYDVLGFPVEDKKGTWLAYINCVIGWKADRGSSEMCCYLTALPEYEKWMVVVYGETPKDARATARQKVDKTINRLWQNGLGWINLKEAA